MWTGGELRSIHFRNMTFGQGAAQALPIFAYYMEKIYKDREINFYRGDFERPSVPIEMDCSNFKEEIEDEGFDWDF